MCAGSAAFCFPGPATFNGGILHMHRLFFSLCITGSNGRSHIQTKTNQLQFEIVRPDGGHERTPEAYNRVV